MLRRIRVNSFVRAAVYGQICLAVAIEIQAPEHHRTLHGLLEDPCGELPALREDDARARDADGENFHDVSGCSPSGSGSRHPDYCRQSRTAAPLIRSDFKSLSARLASRSEKR